MSESVDLGKYLNPAVVSLIDRLDLQAQSIVEGFIAGRHKSPFHGSSSQFSEYKNYTDGDSVKDIDWTAFAKTEKYFIKKYEAETDLACTFLIDLSSSMAFKSEFAPVSKLEYATYLSAAISYMLIKQQDSVGLISFDKEIRSYIPPRSSSSHISKILTELNKLQQSTETDYKSSFQQIYSFLKKKGLIVFISDFLGETEEALKALDILRAQKHDVIVFHIHDPAELDLGYDGLINFEDKERSFLKVSTRADKVRKNYKKEMTAFISKVESHCESLGITHTLVNTKSNFDQPLEEFLNKRKRCF
ncbi:MAG: DUF58 domain-containing protein [Lentisphaeraceae bacterium]|nr:DUF58 domain-containing protein [Lentisphaeraceae bacterium]